MPGQLVTTSNFAANLYSGLVGQWTFDYLDGRDESGNGHTGTKVGDISFTGGKIAKAASFDGNGDYMNLDAYANSIPSGASNITVEAWAKWNVTPTGNSVVVSYGGNNSNKGFLLHYENGISKLDFNVIGV